MRSPSRLVALAAMAALLAPLCAQTKKPQPPKPPKDDKVTAKDPVVKAIDQLLKKRKVDKNADGWRGKLEAPPVQKFDPKSDYVWHLETNKGALVVRLLPDSAPVRVTSTIYLTRLGFYDGLVFHRVIKDFMAQGGCPLGNGNGGPGFVLDSEIDPARKHDKAGIVSMANEDGKARTEGSQFFVTFGPAPNLDGKHTVFGEVIDGDKVLAALNAAGGDAANDKPTEKLEIVRAWIAVAARVAETPAK